MFEIKEYIICDYINNTFIIIAQSILLFIIY